MALEVLADIEPSEATKPHDIKTLQKIDRMLTELYVTTGATAGVLPGMYRALVSQTGTAAPVVTVLQNTLSQTPVWSRDDVGVYLCETDGLWVAGKTFLFCGVQIYGTSLTTFVRVDANTLSMEVDDDNVLVAIPVEITVYP